MGHPGFWSTLGVLAKKAVGLIPGVGPIASSALEHVGTTSHQGQMISTMVRTGAGKLMSMRAAHPTLTAAGAAAAAGGVMALAHGKSRVTPLAMRMSGGMGGRRHRRMNVLNPRALRRSLRRAHGFARFAMKAIHLIHPKKHVTFGGFKKRIPGGHRRHRVVA